MRGSDQAQDLSQMSPTYDGPKGVKMKQSQRTVIVEDDYLISTLWEDLLTMSNIPVVGTAAKPEEAIKLIRRTRPDFVLMDIRLGAEMDGVDIASLIREEQPDTRIVFITASAEPPSVARMNQIKDCEVLFKPVSERQLLSAFKPSALQ